MIKPYEQGKKEEENNGNSSSKIVKQILREKGGFLIAFVSSFFLVGLEGVGSSAVEI